MNCGFSGTFTLGGLQIQASVSRTGLGANVRAPALAAGVAGTLTTRTSDVAGVVTLPDGHGVQSGDHVAVSWTDNANPAAPVVRVMYGLEATVAGDAITLAYDTGTYHGVSPAGSVLPVQGTALILSERVVSDFAVAHADVLAIVVGCDQPAIAILGGASALYVVQVPAANSPTFWDAAAGGTNPLTSDPTTVAAYNCSTVACTLQFGTLLSA